MLDKNWGAIKKLQRVSFEFQSIAVGFFTFESNGNSRVFFPVYGRSETYKLGHQSVVTSSLVGVSADCVVSDGA
jgi:hypothetical protein